MPLIFHEDRFIITRLLFESLRLKYFFICFPMITNPSQPSEVEFDSRNLRCWNQMCFSFFLGDGGKGVNYTYSRGSLCRPWIPGVMSVSLTAHYLPTNHTWLVTPNNSYIAYLWRLFLPAIHCLVTPCAALQKWRAQKQIKKIATREQEKKKTPRHVVSCQPLFWYTMHSSSEAVRSNTKWFRKTLHSEWARRGNLQRFNFSWQSPIGIRWAALQRQRAQNRSDLLNLITASEQKIAKLDGRQNANSRGSWNKIQG